MTALLRGVRPSASAAWAALDLALAGVDPPCKGEPEWCSDDPGDREAAAHLCQPCPVLALCGAYATANQESFGVWGGRDRTTTTQEEARE